MRQRQRDTIREAHTQRQMKNLDIEREQAKELEEQWQSILDKKLDLDLDWQVRSNRINKAPQGCSAAVKQVLADAERHCAEQNYPQALSYFNEALHMPTGCCKELVDNCAIMALLSKDYSRCVHYASACIKLDSTFHPGYLHRARGYRCLGKLDDSMNDLQKAMDLGTPHSLDISRELLLVQLEQKDRRTSESPHNYCKILGVSYPLNQYDVIKSYDTLIHNLEEILKGASGQSEVQRQAVESMKLVEKAFKVA
mmetsp:Transcript_5442/g.9644  ORF Transcript_5442/g.9644 Transcript_5442/m.9644 type:complete len:254 (-) Transcript_5442:30-791(-)